MNLWEMILNRDNYICQGCGAKKRLHVHHIKSRSLGGENTPENLITLCVSCHGKITWRGVWLRKWNYKKVGKYSSPWSGKLELLKKDWKSLVSSGVS